MAAEAKLDLALVSPNAQPPVCKLMNYGKYKFEQAKKEKESRKNQKTFELKELRVTPNIEQHDVESQLKKMILLLKLKMLENSYKTVTKLRLLLDLEEES